jgi:hypothetical protein
MTPLYTGGDTSPIFREHLAKIGRVEESLLRLTADPVHGAGTNLPAGGERGRNVLQESIAQVASERPGRGHHGVEFGIR